MFVTSSKVDEPSKGWAPSLPGPHNFYGCTSVITVWSKLKSWQRHKASPTSLLSWMDTWRWEDKKISFYRFFSILSVQIRQNDKKKSWLSSTLLGRQCPLLLGLRTTAQHLGQVFSCAQHRPLLSTALCVSCQDVWGKRGNDCYEHISVSQISCVL